MISPEFEPRLTESERRRLEELEGQLTAQFPGLARALNHGRPATLAPGERLPAFLAAAVLLGLAALVGGAFGAAAVAITLVSTAGVWTALQLLRSRPQQRSRTAPLPRKPEPPTAG